MNTSNFWCEITLGTFLFLICFRLIFQFKKLPFKTLLFVTLSYLPLSFLFFKKAFYPMSFLRYANIDLVGGIVGLSSFSLLSLMILIVVKNAQDKMGTLLRFPLAGILLGTYVGEYWAWLSFLVVNIVILGLLYLNKENYSLLLKKHVVVCLLAGLSFFIKPDLYFLSSISFFLYIIIFYQLVSQGLIGLLFRNQESQ